MALALCVTLSAATTVADAVAMTVDGNDRGGSFALVAPGKTATLVYDASSDGEVVGAAAEMFSGDVKLITGIPLAIVTSWDGVTFPIVAGTVGKSEFIDDLASAGKIDVSEVSGKWEAFGIEIVDNPKEGIEKALVVYGGTPRGTAYGLLELSRLAGVSPWVWWADVLPEERDALYVSGDRLISGEPSVRFRGIFINDEDFCFLPWASKGLDAKYNNIGPNTYAKVMELLLRLRANVLWPAMHLSSQAFWDNKDNLPVAKKYDIALGSSHCEQMLRDNEWEWRRYDGGTGTNENWNYVTNKAKIQRYWEERVIESKGFSAMYTLGMRGVHDWGISGYPSTEDKVRGLTEIIDFQRSLIEKHIGDPTTVPQIFIPYKEVLDAYNAGLKVPEDVILTWVDDNHGYIRQLPTTSEQKRSGGHGIYYHLSYWGTPADYLWISSNSPSLCSFELVKAYQNGVKDLWVINVGDIKPAEEELEFCMDLAWDIESWQPESAYGYSSHWAGKTFGDDVAEEIGDIKLEYYALAAAAKPEHLGIVEFTNREMDERLERYRALVDRVEAVKGRVPGRLHDAFFEMIEYPVKGACYMNEKIFLAKKSVEEASLGHREEALAYAADARKAYRMIAQITDKYNNEIASGKWKGMMNYKPREQGVFFMPETATLSSISPFALPMDAEDELVHVAATDYKASSGSIKELKGLGISGSSVAVWPMDLKSYGNREARSAPYVEYAVPVIKGENTIEVRALPSFPLHNGGSFRVGVTVNGGKMEYISLKTVATEGKWNTTVARGYNDATVKYTAEADGEADVRVYLLNPAIAISEICNRHVAAEDPGNATDALLVNPDFELGVDGKPNESGISRGVPYGWKFSTTVSGNSYGINQDAKNYHGKNVCWVNASPLPSAFEMSQTVAADKLTPGYYLVRCMLWVENSKKGTCRLFANNNVQYYGFADDYAKILTPGEENTYAGYTGGDVGNIQLKEMAVVVYVKEGEDLTLGIRTGNKRKDGSSATDNTGWFKVDHFRLDHLESAPVAADEDLTLTEQVIKNYDFELYTDGNGNVAENISGETRRYTPYGWEINAQFPGTSYGINNDMRNMHGRNGCWFLPKEANMPDGFELYQEIPGGTLPAGRYELRCKLWAQDGFLGTLRLFANNNVQYYGMDIDYDRNLVPGENVSYAGYVGGQDGDFLLQDMYVQFDLAENEPLRLGLRSGGNRADGTMGDERTGWFKTDYFRLHRLENTGVEGVGADCIETNAPIYNLQGICVGHGAAGYSRLQPGVYVMSGRKFLKY